MKAAVFFQKYSDKKVIDLTRKIYEKLVLRTDEKRVKYLRDAGASIGENVHIEKTSMLGSEPYLVEIGDRVFFSGSLTSIITHDGAMSLTYDMGIAPKPYDLFGKVKIGSNCFVGVSCIILKGVSIGDNCIIGAGSIVTRDIPSGSVACGVPAKVIATSQEYFEKNKNDVWDTHEWNVFEKREYLQQNFSK